MTGKELDSFTINYIEEKLRNTENKEYIRYTFYELKIKCGLSDKEIDKFLEINKNYFENKNYNVYFTDAKFTYKSARITVQPNELMIAVKE